jgi:uncharacterized protein (DUF433 family)
MSEDQALRDFPELARGDMRACLAFERRPAGSPVK